MDSDKKKKIIIIIGAVLVFIIAIIVIVSILGGGSTKQLSYKEAEEKLKQVAENYYKENTSLLPNEGYEREISVNELVKLELIKPLNELIKNGDSCDGKVTIKNNGGKYSYVPYIKCGDDYVTSELYKKIIEDVGIVESGSGIYVQGDNNVFRGENLNNYVKLSDKLWKIISIDSEGNLKLILDKELDNPVEWDDRYNGEREYTSGINNYEISRIKDHLNDLYNSNDLLDENAKKFVVAKNFCISGKLKSDSTNNITCDKYAENLNIGLLNVYEYTYASIDPNCKTISDRECQNYNYLKPNSDSYGWWTMTPNKENTYEVYSIENYGTLDIKNCSSNSRLKPVIYVTKDVMYDSGKGTEKDPYIIK